MPVSVPGTLEEYLHPGNGPTGDYQGVSWWWRTLHIPENVGPRIVLRFESQRHRAEIFVDHQLVGYDVIGGTPFEVDLTGFLGEDGIIGRPAFVTEGADGAIYVSDDYAGVVYRVSAAP